MKSVKIIPLSPKRFDLNGLEAYKQNRGVAVFDRFVDFRYPEARSFSLISLLIVFLTLLMKSARFHLLHEELFVKLDLYEEYFVFAIMISSSGLYPLYLCHYFAFTFLCF